MRDRQEHRARQKRVAHIFGPASVALVEPLIADHIGKFLHAMGDRVGQSLDVMLWFRMMALDITSECVSIRLTSALQYVVSGCARVLYRLSAV